MALVARWQAPATRVACHLVACCRDRAHGNLILGRWKHVSMAETARRKMASYRGRLRARGLRPVQIWVSDLRDTAVRDRLRADAALVCDHPSTAEGYAFVDAALAELADWQG